MSISVKQQRRDKMNKTELTKQLKKQTGVGISRFDLHDLLVWASDNKDNRIYGFYCGINWGLKTQRFSNNAESAMKKMTPAKLVEFMVDVILNCENNQQAVVNYVNAKFRTH